MSDDTDSVKTANQRLAAAQAAREAAQVARAQAEEAASVEVEIKNLEILGKLEDEYGAPRVARVDSNGGMVVVVYQPSMHRKLLEKLQKGVTIAMLKECVTPCVKHPSREAFAEIADEWPQVLLDAQNALAELAGVQQVARSGK